MKSWIMKILAVLLLILFIQDSVYGAQEGTKNQDIPVIVKWGEGHGFGEDGRMICDGWSFDSENGCYVRFKNGGVLVKADCILDAEDYGDYFTDTEQKSGTLAVRGDVIRYFSGSIDVVLENTETHAEEICNLNPENKYRVNLPVPEGCYQIKAAEAVWNENYYEVSFSEGYQVVKEGSTCLFELHVLAECAGEEDGDTWIQVNEDLAKAHKPKTSVNISEEAGNSEMIEDKPVRWTEVYVIFIIFAAAYGIYRFWTGGRQR
ncbi:MAG: hypothetical protein LBT06_20895 [Hungatella sp.]|nr:hypothetical protein [Hungatella sp.]